jgi:hypothetical protein
LYDPFIQDEIYYLLSLTVSSSPTGAASRSALEEQQYPQSCSQLSNTPYQQGIHWDLGSLSSSRGSHGCHKCPAQVSGTSVHHKCLHTLARPGDPEHFVPKRLIVTVQVLKKATMLLLCTQLNDFAQGRQTGWCSHMHCEMRRS